MSFADTIKGISIPETAGRDADNFPRFYYHNGIKAAKTAGSFYARGNDYPTGLAEPWAAEDRFEGEAGYSTPVLKIAVVLWRQQPFFRIEKQPGEKYARKEWLLHWQKGAQFYTEVLCFVEGFDGLAVFASDGLTGKAMAGRGGVIPVYEGGLLAQAETVARQPLPLWAFWLPIATKRTADGKVAYEDTGFSSFVTPPALALPPDPLETLFVGSDLLEKGARYARQYAKWATTKRLPENTVEAEYVVSAAPQIAAPRNVPVVMADTDEL